MKKAIIFVVLQLNLMIFSSFQNIEQKTFPLTIKVKDLRNSNGVVQFALYNNEDSFPDEHFKKFYRILSSKIVNGASEVTFENLPAGKYAVNVLHDENNNSKIDKGFILPKEGIGFSNYTSIGIANRPVFAKASFNLESEKKMMIQMIYL